MSGCSIHTSIYQHFVKADTAQYLTLYVVLYILIPMKQISKISKDTAITIKHLHAPVAELHAPVAALHAPVADLHVHVADLNAPVADLHAPVAVYMYQWRIYTHQ